MEIKETCQMLKGDTHVSPKLRGKTTIELRDAKTGELISEKVEYNMVTNFFQGPYAHDICATYTNQPTDLFALVKGVQLLNHQETEDPSNCSMEIAGSAVTGFGNLQVNAQQTNTKWMSYNLLESGKTQNGYRWVWNANENQCNGPIQCVSLITMDMVHSVFAGTSTITTLNLNRTFSNEMMPMYLGKWVDTPGNAQNTTFSTGTFSNIVHIDWANEIVYDIERDYDNDKRIIIKRYNFNRDKINMRYRLKPTLIDEHVITFADSLNHDYAASSSRIHARPFSVKVDGNFMYLVKAGTTNFAATTNRLRIIKINLTDYTYTDEVKTLTQTFADFYRNYMTTSTNLSHNANFIRDWYPIYKGYVYLTNANGTNIYKVNLNDVSDIEVIQVTAATTPQVNSTGSLSIVTDQNIIFGHIRSNTSSSYRLCLSLKDNATSFTNISVSEPSINIQTGFYLTNAHGWGTTADTYIEVVDGVCTMVHMTNQSQSEADMYSGLTYINQFQYQPSMVTINNVNPVTKTSDKTMKVTYELSEVTE